MDDLMLFSIFENNIVNLIDSLNNGADIHYKNEYPLILACSKGYLNIVIYIVNFCSPDLDAQNGSALRNACVYGYFGVVKFLIESGCNINI